MIRGKQTSVLSRVKRKENLLRRRWNRNRVLINLNSENEGGKEGKKEEEKLVYEGTTIMQTLIIQILRGAPTIPLAIHAPPRKLEFQEFEFLGEKISFQSSRFLIDR